MSSEDVDWVLRAGVKAKGKRPAYFDDPATDRLLSITLALAGEVSVLRDRLNAVERLLVTGGALKSGAVDGFAPDDPVARDRGLATKAFIHRIMRGVQQELEAMASPEPSVEAVSDRLREE